jgi:hypothetical protein
MRLVTRLDFDGLVCAVLLTEVGIIDDISFNHPNDIQHGEIEVTKDDVIANLPYIQGCGLWFDHHSSEEKRLEQGTIFDFNGASYIAPSCARVIFEYYGGAARFPIIDQTGLIVSVDKSDSANLTINEIKKPTGWILLAFILDPRTGLDRYSDYRISSNKLTKDLIQYCRTMSAEEVLKIPDVQERIDRYFQQEKAYEEMIAANSTTIGNVIIINLLDVDEILSGNRFIVYTMYPEQNISIRVIWGFQKQNIVFTCGKSTINKTSTLDIGSLMLEHGGGGHHNVGSCQVPIDIWESELDRIVAALQEK